MGQDPGEIRAELAETRGRLGETAEAIGYKSDVKSRAGDWVSDKKDAVTSRVSGVVPDSGQAKAQARRGARIARENPLGLAVGGAAVGFLLGLATPSTRMEDERMGEAADQVKEAAKEAGQEAFDRGKTVAQEAGQAAAETVRERGSEEGQELAQSVKETAQEASPTSGSR